MLQTVRKRDLAKPLGSALRISEERSESTSSDVVDKDQGSKEKTGQSGLVEFRPVGGRLVEYEHEIWFPDDFE